MTDTGTKVLTEEHLKQLRKDIATELRGLNCTDCVPFAEDNAAEIADRITRIPLIAALLVDHMTDLPQERAGELIVRTHKPQIRWPQERVKEALSRYDGCWAADRHETRKAPASRSRETGEG